MPGRLDQRNSPTQDSMMGKNSTIAPTRPKVVELGEMEACDFWTPVQWAVLVSLVDAILAPVAPESEVTDKKAQIKMPDHKYNTLLEEVHRTVAGNPDKELLKAVFLESFSTNPALVGHMKRTVCTSVHPKLRARLGGVLAAVSTRMGAFFLTGYCTPVHEQPLHIREAIVRGWSASRLTDIRLLVKSLSMFAQNAWLQASPLFKQASGYLDVPHDWKPGASFDFEFLQFGRPPNAEDDKAPVSPAVIDTDVVIVGSGCGGGVCAKILAEAGRKVVVVDKGYYFTPDQFPMPQEQGSRLLCENGGVVVSADGSTNIAAGSTWGGGGTVNWSVCLQTQGFVRREWSQDRGLVFFETEEFQDCLDRVCDYMGAGRGSEHAVKQTHRGQVLLDGCRKLGWHAAALPQNSGGAEHWCGRCMMGCGSAEKQGPAVSWLPAAKKAGATFIEGFQVDKVTFDEASGGKVATGVVGTWTSRDSSGGVTGPKEQRAIRKVAIKAKKVIVSAGSLWSPVVLTKSGVKNRHLGHNLYLHPCNFVGAYYKEDIQPWEGGIITSFCTSFEDLDGHGHGVKLEPTCQIPYTNMSMLPWKSSIDFKVAAIKYRHMDVYIALTRDRDAGRIQVDPTTGTPVVHYTPSDFDRAHTLEGVIATAKCCYLMGATEIRAFLPGVEPFVRRPASAASTDSDDGGGHVKKSNLGINDPDFAAWIKELRRVGNKPPVAPFSSAHQMGTCRMGINEGEGVVNPKGRVWGYENLFVADASVFPSASGVNPMITNMAISDYIARGVDRELAAKSA
ncbi:hypothetical protein PpBr36_00567 [Pyricularia pennisetigena]|uniref:hypothetical protein n=1 Tax=Pyricularia pennisetigena TaxID=1578925 RepID=UPI001152DDB2|nr:hypothetical protein PpBr36_00567 [Pyricularia pennisetigena]TLS28942.1 hypothetical protein PpBr36_00567 [Pyricularia pennisetigena]